MFCEAATTRTPERNQPRGTLSRSSAAPTSPPTTTTKERTHHQRRRWKKCAGFWNRGGRVVVGDDQVGIGREGAACEVGIIRDTVSSSFVQFDEVGRIPTERGPDGGVISDARVCAGECIINICRGLHDRK